MLEEKETLDGKKDIRQFQQKRGLTVPKFDSETFGPRSSNAGHQTATRFQSLSDRQR